MGGDEVALVVKHSRCNVSSMMMSSGYSASSDLSTDWLETGGNCWGQFSFG